MSEVNPLEEPGGVPEITPEVETPETPEVKAEEKPQVTAEEKYQNSLAALREERAEKARLKSALEQARKDAEEFAALKAKLDERQKSIQEEKARQEFEENPAEFLRRQQEEIKAQVQNVSEMTQRQQEAYFEQQRLVSTVQAQTAAFARETPDYNDAFMFMHERRMAEYDVLGVPPEFREEQFNLETMEFARQAMQQGRNPAELAYNMAKAWGFSGKKESKTDPNAVVARLEEGHKAAATLSTGGKSEVSLLKQIDEMSDSEFDNFWKEQMVTKHH